MVKLHFVALLLEKTRHKCDNGTIHCFMLKDGFILEPHSQIDIPCDQPM